MAVGVMFVNQWIAQHKADQVEENTTGQLGSGYNEKYLGSDNSSTEFNEYTMSGDNKQSHNSRGSNQSSQTNSGRNFNSNNNGGSHQTTGLKDKYLKRLNNIQKKADNMSLNSGQTTIEMKLLKRMRLNIEVVQWKAWKNCVR